MDMSYRWKPRMKTDEWKKHWQPFAFTWGRQVFKSVLPAKTSLHSLQPPLLLCHLHYIISTALLHDYSDVQLGWYQLVRTTNTVAGFITSPYYVPRTIMSMRPGHNTWHTPRFIVYCDWLLRLVIMLIYINVLGCIYTGSFEMILKWLLNGHFLYYVSSFKNSYFF